MPLNIALLLLIPLLVITAGCSETQTSKAESIEEVAAAPSTAPVPGCGAWLGEGTFTATNGTQQIKAQLELLADGTYRFMVIEPRVLMMVVGLEKGNWQRVNQELKLNPFPDQTSGGSGKLGALNSAPKNFVPKVLSVDGDTFMLRDSQMDLKFQPNPEATQKLHQRGELG